MSKASRSGPKTKQQKLSKAAEIVGFSDADEAFFNEGESVAETHIVYEDSRVRRPSFWRRLFSSAA
jgi:hypothetical protein